MNTFEKDTGRRRNYAEGVELAAESKEKGTEEAEKKMAARERVEVVSREVKTTKQQIQNIMGNMQAVVKAVAAIRAQLQLAQGGSIPSAEQDKRSLAALKKKLTSLYGELNDLRGALLAEQRKNIQEENPDWSAEEIEKAAKKQVEELWKQLGLEERFTP